ncbi:MAG: hypothetical protein LAO77_24190 [Acidobacteriia bacterium]|nr:hypothetical protein [Terriglobia bacterium]
MSQVIESAGDFALNTPPARRMKVREYARSRNFAQESVRRAIHKKRLNASIGWDNGVPFIADPELADREWALFTKHDRVPLAARKAAPAPPDLLTPTGGEDRTSSRARYDKARADLAELEFRKSMGKLVEIEDVIAGEVKLFTEVRNKLLAIPHQLRTSRPSLTREDIVFIDAGIRWALEALAGDAATTTEDQPEEKTA